MKARVALKTVQSGDWQRSYTRDDTNGAMQQSAARAILEWQPSAGARVTLNVNGWIDRSEPQAVQLIEVACASPPTCPAALVTYPPAPANARSADWTPGFPRSHDHVFQTTLRADVPLGDAVTLTSISGYQRFRQDKGLDEDSTSLPVFDALQIGRARSFNQELRLAGNAGRLRWLAGGYATWQDVEDDFTAGVAANSVSEPLPGVIPRVRTAGGAFNFRTRSLASFGNLEYRIGYRLTLIGGLRYTASRQLYRGCERSPDPALGQLFAFLSALARGTLPVVDPVPADGCVSIDATMLRQGLTRDRLSESNVSWRMGAVRAGTAMGAAAKAAYGLGQETAGASSVSAGAGGIVCAAGAAARSRMSNAFALSAAANEGRAAAWSAVTGPAGAGPSKVSDQMPDWARGIHPFRAPGGADGRDLDSVRHGCEARSGDPGPPGAPATRGPLPTRRNHRRRCRRR